MRWKREQNPAHHVEGMDATRARRKILPPTKMELDAPDILIGYWLNIPWDGDRDCECECHAKLQQCEHCAEVE